MTDLSLPLGATDDVPLKQKLVIGIDETARRALEVLEVQAESTEQAENSTKGDRFGMAVVQLIAAVGEAKGRDDQSVWEEGLRRVMETVRTRTSLLSAFLK